jgi:hypothetical protein
LAGDAGHHLRVQVTASDNGTPGSASQTAVSTATLVTATTSPPTVTTPATLTTATPTIAGTGTGSAIIRIYDGSVLIGTVTADSNGAWTWTAVTPLAPGTHVLTVTAELAPSGESNGAGPITIIVPSSGSGSSTNGLQGGGGGGGGGGGCGAGGLLGLLGLCLSLTSMRRNRRSI